MEKALKYDKALQPVGTWEISESEENDKGCGLADRVLRAKKPRKQLRVRSPRTSNAVPGGVMTYSEGSWDRNGVF